MEQPHKRHHLVSVNHSVEAFQHAVAGDRVVHSNSIHRHSGCPVIDVRCRPDDMCDAFATSPGGSTRTGCTLGTTAELLGDGSCHQPPKQITYDNAVDPSVIFLECCHATHPQCVHDFLRCLSTGESNGHLVQMTIVCFHLQHGLQMFSCHAGWPAAAPFLAE